LYEAVVIHYCDAILVVGYVVAQPIEKTNKKTNGKN
jgi:hypothetical protein